MNILIIGGAGFIGSHLARRLVLNGHQVTILDNLNDQVHGKNASFPASLVQSTRCVRADVCDEKALAREVHGKDIIVNLAAETGTGQSMYEIRRYQRVNIGGTAALFELLVNQRPKALKKVLVASSRAIYGEGTYRCETHGIVHPRPRTTAAMAAGHFEPVCPDCNASVTVLPTSEAAPLGPSSFYGLTKQVQEQMTLMFANALGIDAFALRYQNVYGPGQSLTNSYTGILAVFSNLVRLGKPINVFEDGLESRDFVYVDDAVDATISCMASTVTGVDALNVGSGKPTTVYDVAAAINVFFKAKVPLIVSGSFRAGDIRHNFADLTRISSMTGFVPKWNFEKGLEQFLLWAQSRQADDAGFEKSIAELKERGFFGERSAVAE